jgi:iron(III) transport system permease protein
MNGAKSIGHKQPRLNRPNRTGLGALALGGVAIAIAAPIAATLLGAFAPPGLDWSFLSGMGLRYLSGTVFLCLLVAAGAGALGAGAAMVVALTDFPGRRVMMVALALPFAIPAYVAAYAYGDFLGPFGPVADVVGAQNLPEIRSLPGAAFILTLMTYPYVYLALSASLAGRSSAYMEAARALGASPARAAWRVLLTMGRPALAGGLALALMETAADYGVADFFGVATLSVGIFRTWQGLGDLGGATQLAVGLFFVALILVLIEEAGRRGEHAENVKAHRRARRLKLSPLASMLAILFCLVPVALGFIIPAGVLIAKFDPNFTAGAARGLNLSLANTALVATLGGVLTITLAVFLGYMARRMTSPFGRLALRVATLGYAIPGAVIAIGVLALTAWLSRVSGLALAGGIGVLLYAYMARFVTAGYNAAAGGLQQISPQMDDAAKMLGAGPASILKDVHWPQMRGAVAAGAAIIMIDIAKELPATLLLRPFNFETLATRIYRLASDERLADAAPAALMLIGLGLIPTLALSFIATNNSARKSIAPSAGG